MASFYRIDSKSSRLPSMLSALEEQNFLFQLQLQDKAEEDSSEVRRHDDDCAGFLHFSAVQSVVLTEVSSSFR